MTSDNTRNTKIAAAPEPDDSGLLLNLAEMKAAALAATPTAKRMAAAASRPQQRPIVWSPATIKAAESLPVKMELPTRYPSRGPSAQMSSEPAFVAAPKDLGSLNGPTCPDGAKHPLLIILRAAVRNEWYGQPVYKGASAATGGVLPLPVLLTMLGLEPAHQKARKWSQILTGSGQTNLLAQVANVAGRFAICRPEGITLVQDFYAPVD